MEMRAQGQVHVAEVETAHWGALPVATNIQVRLLQDSFLTSSHLASWL